VRRHQLACEVRLVALAPERAQRRREPGLQRLEHAGELAILGDDPRPPALVIVAREHVLPRVRERPVPDIVEQRRDLHVARERGIELEPPRHALRDVKRTERMAKPRVLRARIHEPREPHLLDPTQPLHRVGIEQIRQRPVLALEFDEPVHRISKHAIFHARRHAQHRTNRGPRSRISTLKAPASGEVSYERGR
jgi:hypothetical protein